MRAIATLQSVYGPGANAVGGTTFATTPTGVQGSSPSADTRNTADLSAVPIPITQVFTGLQGSVMGQPLTWLFGLVLLLIAFKLIEEHRGGREAFSEIKLGLNNVVKIGLSAVLFIVVTKFLFTRYDVPGLSPLFKAG
jgi:hypothetical protein